MRKLHVGWIAALALGAGTAGCTTLLGEFEQGETTAEDAAGSEAGGGDAAVGGNPDAAQGADSSTPVADAPFDTAGDSALPDASDGHDAVADGAHDATFVGDTGVLDAANGGDAPAPDAASAPDASAPDGSGIDAGGTDATTSSDAAAAIDAATGADSGTPRDAGDGGAVEDAGPPDAPSCVNACSLGAAECLAGTPTTCVVGDAGCTVWAPESKCGAHQSCVGLSDGGAACACVSNACSAVGAQCSGSNAFVECASDDAGCLFVADSGACPVNEYCNPDAGAIPCSLSCTNLCASGQSICNSGGVSSCVLGAAGCYVWGDAGACSSPYLTCVASGSTASCQCATSACTGHAAGDLVCTDAGTTATCEKDSASGCMVPTNPTGCPGGGSCSSGVCYCPTTNVAACGASCCSSFETCLGGTTCGCANGGTVCGGVCCGAGQICVSAASSTCGLPTTISPAAQSTLGLWLTSDEGVQCDSNGRVTYWDDLSGHARVVKPFSSAPLLADGGVSATIIGAHEGPICPTATGHKIDGIPVVYFDSPTTTSPYVAGTLDVDLSFLTGGPFTIVVVERRWLGPLAGTAGVLPNEGLIGTIYPPPGTISDGHFAQLYTGYVTWPGKLQTAFDLGGGSTGTEGDWCLVPTGGAPVAPTIDVWESSSTMTVYLNGSEQPGARGACTDAYGTVVGCYVSASFKPWDTFGLIGAAGGVAPTDNRFNGDIAEVLIFASALSAADQTAVQNYLIRHWGGGDAGAFPPYGGSLASSSCP